MGKWSSDAGGHLRWHSARPFTSLNISILFDFLNLTHLSKYKIKFTSTQHLL